MRRFDLGMSINYVKEWGVSEAVRELIQNAFDAQTANPENKMFFDYDVETLRLRIGNTNGRLATDTLLLGKTSKDGREDMIGQHGEGYKVATVVLLREGKGLKVYNHGCKEVWTAKVINSRRYGTEVVVFDIEKSIFTPVPDHDLIFEVEGITLSEYDEIVRNTLHLQNLKEGKDFIQAGNSRILLGEQHRGRLYVGGLYVSSTDRAKLGYDFEPTKIKLDRDRSFVDSLDLQFLCGQVLATSGDTELIDKMRNSWEGEYIRFYIGSSAGNYSGIFDNAHDKFIKKYGSEAIPVTTTEEFNKLHKRGYIPSLVTNNEYYYITNSEKYEKVDTSEECEDSLSNRLKAWFETNITEDMECYESGLALINEVVEALAE